MQNTSRQYAPSAAEAQIALAAQESKTVKCVVWDLDNTIWDGVLLEDAEVSLKPNIINIIKTLDERGILQSIASKNNYDDAKQALEKVGLWQYFLYPQISWNAKSQSLKSIAESLNISLDVFAFVDDQSFERDEVRFSHPEVETYADTELHTLLDQPRLLPKFITPESKLRRKLYQCDIERKVAEDDFHGADTEFLRSLNMVFRVKIAEKIDLQRAEELTMRTHQLNSTGYTYSYSELEAMLNSPKHVLLVSSLEDKFGTYGAIGLALAEKHDDYWMVKLLLMSCRVMSRGVGAVMLNYLMQQAKLNGVKLRAEFVNNDRNRMMHITYKFSGFKTIKTDGDFMLFEHNLKTIPDVPDHLVTDFPERV